MPIALVPRRRPWAGRRGPPRSWRAPDHRRCLRHASARSAAIPRSCACWRSEEHTSELQSLMRISYAVFCLKKKKKYTRKQTYLIKISEKKNIKADKYTCTYTEE